MMKSNLMQATIAPLNSLNALLKHIAVVVTILVLSSEAGWAQTSSQNFGTTAGSHANQTGSTAFIPNPTSGTTYARAGAAAASATINLATTSNPLGSSGAYLRAVSSTSASVSKMSPIVGYTGGAEFYTKFTILFGDSSASTTASSGVWTFYQGAVTATTSGTYIDNNDVASANAFIGLRFTYGASGALTLTYNNNNTYNSVSLTTSSFSQGIVYTVEIVANNKTSGTISYTYNGVAQTVAVQKFDLFINGTKVGDDLTKGGLAANTAVDRVTFTGVNSTANAANIFVDDVIVYNAVPATIGTAGSTPPTLTAAVGATVDSAFDVTFTEDATWRGLINGITVGGTTLSTSAYSTTAAGKITFTPSASALLQNSGSKSIVVSATGYSDASVTQSIAAGAANKLAMITQPAAPTVNGNALATQPVVAVRDQYGNATTSTANIVAQVGSGTWTIGGTTTKAAVAGTATFTDLTATSAALVSGATISFASSGLTGITSTGFTIPAPAPSNDNPSGATVLTVNAAPVSGTLVNSTQFGANGHNDVYYSFVANSATATVTIDTFSATGDKDLYAYSVLPTSYSTTVNVVASGTGVSTSSETATATTLTPGNTYWIMVRDFGDAGGTFNISVTGPGATPPTLTAAAGATVDNPFVVTFPDDPAWRAAITSITVGGTTLSASAYTITSGQITFTPSASTLFQSTGSKSIVVIATGYSNDTVTQSLLAGTPTKLGITTQPTAPTANGGALAAQPVVTIQDQYGNTTTSTANVVAQVGAGAWTIGGTTTKAGVAGVATYTGLTATSLGPVTGATIAFSSSGLTGITSSTFNIPAPAPPTLTAAAGATVNNPFTVTFTDNATWRAAITSITVGGTTLSASAYTIASGQITFTPSASSPASLLQSSGSKSIVVIATGYNNDTVTQSLLAGTPAKLGITTQPTAPTANGGALAAQPVVAIQDQYGNATTSTANVVAQVGAGAWTIGGTTTKAGVAGTATFTDLTATSAAAVTGATISFTSAGLTGVTSAGFNIPSPPLPFASGNLTVLRAASTAGNTTCSVLELNTVTAGQTPLNTIAIDGTGANALRFAGSSTSSGYLGLNSDRTLLTFTGANSTDTSTAVSALLTRGVGTLNTAKSFALQTTYTGSSGNQTRGATTLDNSTWFIGDGGGLYSNGSTTPSPNPLPSLSLRAMKSFGGTVYTLQASGTATIIVVSTISAATGGTITGLPGLPNNANASDYYLISSGDNGSAYDVLYISAFTTQTAGTILKYSLVSGSWVANGTYTTTFGGFSLTAADNGSGALLYVTTGSGASTANSVIKLADTAGYNANIAITTANNVTLYTAPAGTNLKGIEFTPKLAQTITFGALTDKTYGDTSFSLGATASSGLTVSYTSADPTVASVSGNTVTILKAGSTIITASQAGDATYGSAQKVSQTLAVNQLPLTLSGSRVYDATITADFSILTVANPVGADVVTLASGSGTLASANGGLQTISSFAGLTLGGPAAANYTLIGASGSVRINPAPGTISIATTTDTPVNLWTNKLMLIAQDGATAFSIASITNISDAGFAVQLSGTNIVYTPTGGFTGLDKFYYTLSDGSGGSSVGTVDVIVNASNVGSRILDLVVVPSVSATLTASGIPNAIYKIQKSDNSGGSWQDLGTATAAANGVIIYTDETLDPSGRWYRLAQ